MDNDAHLLEIQLQHQQMLAEAALTLSSTLDLNVLLSRVVQIAVALLDVEGAAILLPDDTRTHLDLRAHEGEPFQEQVRFEVENSLPGNAFRSEQVLVAKQEQNFFPGYHLQMLVCIPLRVRRLVVGVLCVYDQKKPREISPYELGILEQLAAHAAVAIENARLYHSSQARSFELALIIDATEAVNSTLSLPRVLSLIGKNLLQALQAECCEVHICDDSCESLSAWSYQSNSIWPADYAQTFRPMPELLSPDQPWLYIEADTPGMEAILDRAHQAVLIPAWHEGKLLGVMQLAFITERLPRFDEASVSRAALNIAHNVTNQQITRALHLIRQLRREALVDWGNYWVWDEAQGVLRLTVSSGDAVWFREPYPIQLMKDYPTFRKAIEDQAISCYSLSDVEIPPDVRRIMERMYAQVLMVVPLIIQNSNSGIVLITHNRREAKYDSREINLAHALVLQAANAIKNAQLYGDLQNSLEELRRTQAQLVQAARLSAIGQLAAAVAHQINNPLTTVLADSQIVLADLAENDPSYESLKAIRRAGQRAHEVVKRLLTIARAKSENDTPEPMDINLTVKNTLALVESTLYRSRVELQLDLGEKLPRAYGIPGHLEDVWLNLIINARDALATYQNAMIGIRSRYYEDLNAVQVELWDNGPGIEPDNKKVFEAFYTTKPPGEGTGLGLYICRHVVESCGGEMHIDPTYRDGAKFIVTLPCAKEKIASVEL